MYASFPVVAENGKKRLYKPTFQIWINRIGEL